MFVRIYNEASKVSRTHIEKLGISTKRDNDESIGMFGSGSKLAPIAALRSGMEWVVCASDSDGEFTLSYDWAMDDEGIKHVVFDYGDYVKESSYTIDAGCLSWSNPFQIFREAYCNAIDEFIVNGADFGVEIVNDIFHTPGYCNVFISATDEMKEIANNLDQYFLYGDSRSPIENIHGVKIYNTTGESRVYSKGILVNWDSEFNSLFDYDASFQLNEERRATYLARDLRSAIRTIVPTVKSHEYIDKILLKAVEPGSPDNFFEMNMGQYDHWGEWSDEWVNGWKRLFGDAYLVCPSDNSNIIQIAEQRNIPFKIVCSPYWFEVLAQSGIQKLKDILDEASIYDIVKDLSFMQKEVLTAAVDVISQFEPGIKRIPILGFRQEIPTALGVYLKRDRKILISEAALVSVQSAVATLIHEYDHHTSGLGDTTEFRNLADERIASLMMLLINKGKNNEEIYG